MSDEITMSAEVIHRNFVAMKTFNEATREGLRAAERAISEMKNIIATQDNLIKLQNQQMGLLQAKVLGGRATG